MGAIASNEPNAGNHGTGGAREGASDSDGQRIRAVGSALAAVLGVSGALLPAAMLSAVARIYSRMPRIVSRIIVMRAGQAMRSQTG